MGLPQTPYPQFPVPKPGGDGGGFPGMEPLPYTDDIQQLIDDLLGGGGSPGGGVPQPIYPTPGPPGGGSPGGGDSGYPGFTPDTTMIQQLQGFDPNNPFIQQLQGFDPSNPFIQDVGGFTPDPGLINDLTNFNQVNPMIQQLQGMQGNDPYQAGQSQYTDELNALIQQLQGGMLDTKAFDKAVAALGENPYAAQTQQLVSELLGGVPQVQDFTDVFTDQAQKALDQEYKGFMAQLGGMGMSELALSQDVKDDWSERRTDAYNSAAVQAQQAQFQHEALRQQAYNSAMTAIGNLSGQELQYATAQIEAMLSGQSMQLAQAGALQNALGMGFGQEQWQEQFNLGSQQWQQQFNFQALQAAAGLEQQGIDNQLKSLMSAAGLKNEQQQMLLNGAIQAAGLTNEQNGMLLDALGKAGDLTNTQNQQQLSAQLEAAGLDLDAQKMVMDSLQFAANMTQQDLNRYLQAQELALRAMQGDQAAWLEYQQIMSDLYKEYGELGGEFPGEGGSQPPPPGGLKLPPPAGHSQGMMG